MLRHTILPYFTLLISRLFICYSSLLSALYDLHLISCATFLSRPSLHTITQSNPGTIFPLYQWGQYCTPPRVTPCQLARLTSAARTHRAVSTPLCCTRRYVFASRLLFCPLPCLLHLPYLLLLLHFSYLCYVTTTYSLFHLHHFSSTSTCCSSLSVCFLSV